MLRRQNSKQKGFTLIEAMIATFLFVIVISSVISIYLTVLKVNRKSNAIRLASENSRYISEYISKEIRNGQIDYYGPNPCGTGFPSGASPFTYLPILNVDGDHLCFSSFSNDLYLVKGNSNYPYYYKINDLGTQVLNFKVYLKPEFNPYCSNPPSCTTPLGSSIQPRVTIVGTVRANADPQNIIDMPFETSISLPLYDISH